MQKPMTVQKTTVINVDGKPIQTDDLPTLIRHEIDTYDRIRQESLDLEYKLEIAAMATRYKEAQIMQLINEHFGIKSGDGDEE